MKQLADALREAGIAHRVEADLSINYLPADEAAIDAIYQPMVSDYISNSRDAPDYSCKPEVIQRIEEASQSPAVRQEIEAWLKSQTEKRRARFDVAPPDQPIN